MGEDFHVVCALLYSGSDEAARAKTSVVTVDPYILKAIQFAHVDVDSVIGRGNDVVR